MNPDPDPVTSTSTDGASTVQPAVRHSLFRNLMAMGTSQVASWLLGLVSQIIQPRFLGPDGLGQIQLAFSLWIVAQVFVGLGTSTYLTLEMARDEVRGARLVGPILLIRAGAFAIASIGMVGYAELAGVDREIRLLLVITGVSMLLNTALDVFAAAIVGLEQMSYVSIATIVSKFLYTIVMVIVLTTGGGVVGLAWATVFNAALAVAIVAYFYRRLGRVTFPRPAIGYAGIVKASAGFMVAGVIVTMYMQVDMVVMSWLVGEDALGWYTSADVLRSSMGFVPGLIMVVLFPMIGRLHAVGGHTIAEIVRRAYRILALAGLSMGFGLAVVAEPFAVLLFGEDFREAGDVLAVFGLSLPVMFLTMLLGQVALATKQEWFWNRIMFVGIVMAVAFDLVFVPLFDRHAGNAAIAGALGYLVTEGFMVVVGTRRIAPELADRDSLVRLAKMVVAASAMFLVAWPLRDVFLIVPMIVGATVFVAGVVALRILTPEDRELLWRLANRLGIPARMARRRAAVAPDELAVPLDAHDNPDPG